GINANYRNGTLYFYDNTVVNQVDQSDRWRTTMFQLDNNQQAVDARNNIFLNTPETPGAAASNFEFAVDSGVMTFGANWVSPGWMTCQANETGGTFGGTITGTNNFFVDPNNNPGFVNLATYDVHLTTGSSAIGLGGALAAGAASFPVARQ